MCWFHHRTIDTSGWSVRMLSGVPHIRPPAGLDSGGGRRAVTKSPTRLADQRKRHAGHAWRWFYTHLFDLAIVVLPMLRPLRLLRLVTILAVLQRTAGAAFRGRVIIYVAGATLLLVWVAALAVLDAERGHDGSIQILRDGLWWAFVTVTTVGYGDYFPVTPTGQLVAVGVMIGGIALIGVVTATLASWIVEKVSNSNEAEKAATKAHIDELATEIRQ